MNWVQRSVKRSKNLKDHYKMHDIDIYIKDALPENINADLVFSTVSRMVPQHLLKGIDIVYVGQFDVFEKKKVNAVYQDGAIYVTNEQTNDSDMIDDIVHEIAHSVEEIFGEEIYNDVILKNEFLAKRAVLYNLLSEYDYNPPKKIKYEYHYSVEIDRYLYSTVGWDALWNFINGLFLSPYSTVSLREYFAVGFENYYFKDKSSIKENCPVLYSKLELLEYMGEK